MKVRPQKGKQTDFLSTTADICVYGGAAGGGKSYALLMEAARNISVDGYGAVIFRQSLTEIDGEGALWDTADSLYPYLGGRGVKNRLTFHWDEFNTKVRFRYLARDADVYSYQGHQIPFIGFDELTHFSKKQFFYMLSRNRSMCGVKPYVRATCNPDADSWVREFIDWWIDEKGYVIEERSGVIRWFVNQNDFIYWFDTKEQADKAFPPMVVDGVSYSKSKSFTFISSNIFDNQILMKADPDYLTNLEAQESFERERLLKGNWDVQAGAGDYFKKSYFEIVDALPRMKKVVRCWDLASTKPSEANPDPDWTVGMKAGIDDNGIIYIIDAVFDRVDPAGVESLFKNTGTQDGRKVSIRIPQDPGAAGKMVARTFIKMMAGYDIKAVVVSGDKQLRARPASAQAGIGNIKMLRGDWNAYVLKVLEGFPVVSHDDVVDTLSDCVDELANRRAGMRVIKKPKQFT